MHQCADADGGVHRAGLDRHVHLTASREALYVVDLDVCATSPFVHYEDVPHRYTEAWACAVADVLEQMRDANADAELMRAVRWRTALHDTMLWLPPRIRRR